MCFGKLNPELSASAQPAGGRLATAQAQAAEPEPGELMPQHMGSHADASRPHGPALAQQPCLQSQAQQADASAVISGTPADPENLELAVHGAHTQSDTNGPTQPAQKSGAEILQPLNNAQAAPEASTSGICHASASQSCDNGSTKQA